MDFELSAWNCKDITFIIIGKISLRNKISLHYSFMVKKHGHLSILKISFMAQQLCWIVLDCTCVPNNYTLRTVYKYVNYHSCKMLEKLKNAPWKCLKSAWIWLWKRSRKPEDDALKFLVLSKVITFKELDSEYFDFFSPETKPRTQLSQSKLAFN